MTQLASATRFRRPLGVAAALSLAAAAGLFSGSYVVSASAGTCDIENRDLGDAPQDIRDTDDGEDEDNRWEFHAGRDFARSPPARTEPTWSTVSRARATTTTSVAAPGTTPCLGA